MPALLPPLRRYPDRRAPDGVSPGYRRFRIQLARCAAYPLLPFYTLHWLITRPLGQPLRTYLASRLGFWTSTLAPLLPEAQTMEQAAQLPADEDVDVDFGDAWEGVNYEVLTVPPAPLELCSEYAHGPEIIQRVERPMFVLTPPGAMEVGSAPPATGEKIIFYVHGGGYIIGHPVWTPFSLKLAKDNRTRVFSTQYRKCVNEETAWPAPLLDVLAAWNYLTVTKGFSPASILLLGDSAGAHLSLALIQQLSVLQKPMPGGMALCSPWADFTFSFPSWSTNIGTDFLTKTKLGNAVQSTTRYYSHSARTLPIFSPALAPEGTWSSLKSTHVFVSIGTSEVMADEGYALVEGMRRDGVDVTVFEDMFGLHTGPVTGSRPGAYEAFSAGVKEVLAEMP